MSMYSDFEFQIIPIHPSGMVSYRSGKATSQRKFLVRCDYAEELALRLLGKYSGFSFTPILPAPFPGRNNIELVASGFSVTPMASCCFNTEHLEESDEIITVFTNPVSSDQFEKYYFLDREEGIYTDCMCEVVIDYEEDPCDCMTWNRDTETWTAHPEILPGTCVSMERNPAYEMFTLPNANLVWKNFLNGQGQQENLHADSYAYKIIPKADIIVSWHNVPVQYLCQIETHLKGFRGTVNAEEWGDVIQCREEPTESDSIPCEMYEPETILFIDWEEDRSKRTDAFGGNVGSTNMNTTTLKLHFKQKRVEFESSNSNSVSDDDVEGDDDLSDAIAGWNHLFTDSDAAPSAWMRVVVKSTQDPIFPLRAFSNIMYPDPL